MVEDLDVEEDLDSSYLIPECNLKDYSARIIKGDKVNSNWLVVENQFIFHKNDSSVDGNQVYWDCSRRKQNRFENFLV